MRRHWERTLGILAIPAMLLAGAICAPVSDASPATSWLSVQYDGTWASNNLHSMVDDGTTYVELKEISPVLQQTVHIDSTRTASQWKWKLPANLHAPTGQTGKPKAGSFSLTINGQYAQSLAIVQKDGRSYISVADLMAVLDHIGVFTTWRFGYLLGLFDPVNRSQLSAYQHAHPKWKIGTLLETHLGADDAPALVVQNAPPGEGVHNGTMMVSVVSPDKTVHDFASPAWHPLTLANLTVGKTNQVSVVGIDEDVNETLMVLGGTATHPKILHQFHGLDGVDIWLQNGIPTAMTSTGLKGVPGNPMDFEVKRKVYQDTNGTWRQTAAFVTGGYQFEPKLQVNPDVAAMTFLRYAGSTQPPLQATTPLYQVTKAALAELKRDKAQLQALPKRKPTVTFAMNAGGYGHTKTYSTTLGKDTLFVSLKDIHGWTITDVKLLKTP